ncbi:hypothetical protein MBAV_002819 [Candidatus Magnetobacterium bavaricum]|uniref:Uncharacterized protein n=1 Tax=Candidatus Magnetobacterium bavaricum TaxID=29290 RepID=A0A0F3GWE1_9BACT|nr:hypothetical protein MBAV_002819 [Candidatus Magnetobacterium bavaricum]
MLKIFRCPQLFKVKGFINIYCDIFYCFLFIITLVCINFFHCYLKLVNIIAHFFYILANVNVS